MHRQLVELTTNWGTLHVQFDWEDNIALAQSMWLKLTSTAFLPEWKQEPLELLAYCIGEGEPAIVGKQYRLLEVVEDNGIKHFTYPNCIDDGATPTGRFLFATVVSNKIWNI